jgi:hypothetical protein
MVRILMSFILVFSSLACGQQPNDQSVTKLTFLQGQWRGQVHVGMADQWWTAASGEQVTGVYTDGSRWTNPLLAAVLDSKYP